MTSLSKTASALVTRVTRKKNKFELYTTLRLTVRRSKWQTQRLMSSPMGQDVQFADYVCTSHHHRIYKQTVDLGVFTSVQVITIRFAVCLLQIPWWLTQLQDCVRSLWSLDRCCVRLTLSPILKFVWPLILLATWYSDGTNKSNDYHKIVMLKFVMCLLCRPS